MSKNTNLLQRAEVWLDTIPAQEIADATQHAAQSRPETVLHTPPATREEALKLVHRLFLAPGEAARKAVTFAAVDSQNGCSLLCATIARLLAESDSGSVCLVEGNLRAAPVPESLEAKKQYGLADALRKQGAIVEFAKQLDLPNLWLLPPGGLQHDTLNLLSGDRMKEIVRELRAEFDYLVVEAPPLNAYADGMVLSRLTDGVVLVVEANRTRREAALRITESLRTSGIQVLGAVLNNRTYPIPAALYKRL